MFQSASRSAYRRLLASRLPLKSSSTGRFLSTAPPSQRSRSWKSSAARWALAIGGVYYYNTSSVFAEQPDEAIARLDDKLHQIQESNLPTLDTIVEEKRKRLAKEQTHEATTKAKQVPITEDDAEEPGSVQDLEDEADQQGAFNPETGEINWDCPCLGGMAHGPCGEEFKAAFSCFVYSKEEPKGMECIDKFKGMQDCFRQHPEMYGSELEDDDDEVEEELRAHEAAATSEGSTQESEHTLSPLQSSQSAAQKELEETNLIKSSNSADNPGTPGNESTELTPKDFQRASSPDDKTA